MGTDNFETLSTLYDIKPLINETEIKLTTLPTEAGLMNHLDLT